MLRGRGCCWDQYIIGILSRSAHHLLFVPDQEEGISRKDAIRLEGSSLCHHLRSDDHLNPSYLCGLWPEEGSSALHITFPVAQALRFQCHAASR